MPSAMKSAFLQAHAGALADNGWQTNTLSDPEHEESLAIHPAEPGIDCVLWIELDSETRYGVVMFKGEGVGKSRRVWQAPFVPLEEVVIPNVCT